MAKNQFTGAHVINIDDLREICENESRLDQIHKIHSNSCDKDKKDYEPSHLSIGPYYHGSPALHATKKMKWAYLNYLLTLNYEKNLHDYIDAIKGLEKQARSFYGDEIKMDRKSFVEMLLLDACFILMTLNGTDGIVPDSTASLEGIEITMDDQNNDQLVIDVHEDDQITETNESHANGAENNSYDIHGQLRTKYMLRDMLLIENQIPFFVITKIYEIVTRGIGSISLLVENVSQSISNIFNCQPEAIKECNPKEIYHLLHLCHMYFKPQPRNEEKYQSGVMRKVFKEGTRNLCLDHGYETPTVRRVLQYHEARIKLEKREFSNDTPHSLLDIRFVNDTMEIPCLSIDLETITLLKNLIAFEKKCPQSGNYFTSYVLFWSHFITTPDDVALLSEKGIIRHNFYRNSEVVDHFKSLTDCVGFDLNGENYLTSLCNMMEAHYQIRRPKWKELFVSIKMKILAWTRHSRFELPIRLS